MQLESKNQGPVPLREWYFLGVLLQRDHHTVPPHPAGNAPERPPVQLRPITS